MITFLVLLSGKSAAAASNERAMGVVPFASIENKRYFILSKLSLAKGTSSFVSLQSWEVAVMGD
jgi:hypothetical protein